MAAHHGHTHAPNHFGRAFALGIALNAAFVVVELVYGLLAGSLALVADAGHNASDVLALLIAWGAFVLAKRRPSARYTYGLRRSSILASLINAVLLFVAVGAIGLEAVRRLLHPSPLEANVMIGVAALGILINGFTAWLFAAGRHHDLNIRGAFLHMLTDALVSLGVVVAGVLIYFTHWIWLDPAISLVISLVIVLGTWHLLRDSLSLALDGVPLSVDILALAQYLQAQPGVEEVHDLHVWAMSTTETALTAHLVIPTRDFDDAALAFLVQELHDQFGIEHATIQVERGDKAYPCHLASDEVI